MKEVEKAKITLDTEKINKRKTRIKLLKMGLLILLLFLIIVYFILGVIYGQGAFTVVLDQDFTKKAGIVLYEKLEEKNIKRILKTDNVEFMDNISINWLPANIENEAEGSHNGDNYIAYTFYVENQGSNTIDYWYTIVIEEVVKRVDDAVRIMIYQNDKKTIYAKSKSNGEAEAGTIPFYSDQYAFIEQRENFQEGMIDKFTVVIWLEGDDPDCVDDIIGGVMKMHLEITEENKQ